MMGGYGGSSGRTKGKCYYDTGGHKVKDKNAIEVAEQYMSEGREVLFLQEKQNTKRPDLLVDRELLVEVKGISTTNSGQVSKNIKKAFQQIESELSHHPENERKPFKVVIVSRHDNFEAGFKAVREGYQEAKRKGYVTGPVEFWYHGQIYVLE